MLETLWRVRDTISISFLDDDHGLAQKVASVARQWTGLDMAHLTFAFTQPAETDIRISFRRPGSWSVLGTTCRRIDRSEPTMNFGWLDNTSTDEDIQSVVLHEFGHALGFIHEHQDPLNPIQWNRQAVIHDLSGPPNNWAQDVIERNMFDMPPLSEVVATPVDKSSIMMYPIPASWTDGTFQSGVNYQLSDSDRDLVRRKYQ